jgi:hypothetical protein
MHELKESAENTTRGTERELDAEEASDKPHRVVETKRVCMRNVIKSLVISWLGMGVPEC